MKTFITLSFCIGFLACNSEQKGNANYGDSANAKMDTTSVPYTSTPSDSTKPDSTVKDSTYHK